MPATTEPTRRRHRARSPAHVRAERLAALGPDDLAGLLGGKHVPTDCNCLTHGYACDLPSLPINTCLCPIATGLSCGICLEPARDN